MRYSNAGHDAPYILPAAADTSLFTNHSSLLPVDPNLPIGVMPDWNFTEQEADSTSGDAHFFPQK